MAQTATLPASREDYINAMRSLSIAAADFIAEVDAGHVESHGAVGMLRTHVEAYEATSESYFGPAREVRRPADVHPAHEEIEP